MDTAKVFMSGRSQAIRLPKEYRFDDEEVYINKVGASVILMPKTNPWNNLIDSLDMFPDDFMVDGRSELPPENRESFDD